MKRCERCQREHDGSYGSGRFCSQKCANTRVYSEDEKKEVYGKVSASLKGNVPWNKGIGKPKPKHKKRQKKVYTCELCHKKMNRKKRYCSNDCKLADPKYRLRLSKSLKGKSGGIRKGSGIGKSGWYKEYWCDSSWELAWILYNLGKGVQFERNKEGFQYEYNGKIHKFYPDFVLPDGSYVEIKGVMTDRNKAKIKQFNKKLIVLTKKEMTPIIEEVISKYGKDFLSLYN